MSGSAANTTPDGPRRLLQRILRGPIPEGDQFDACRAMLRSEPDPEAAFAATCMLLEGALADPELDIDDTQLLVRLLKDLAAGRVPPKDLL